MGGSLLVVPSDRVFPGEFVKYRRPADDYLRLTALGEIGAKHGANRSLRELLRSGLQYRQC